jgi:hypothetical protein
MIGCRISLCLSSREGPGLGISEPGFLGFLELGFSEPGFLGFLALGFSGPGFLARSKLLAIHEIEGRESREADLALAARVSREGLGLGLGLGGS